jgi:hypothetical protein
MFTETPSRLTRGDSFTPTIFDHFDEDFSLTGFDVSRQKKLIQHLIPRLMAAQREYLMFLNAIETYFRTTILSTQLHEFTKILDTRPGLVDLVKAHKNFIFVAADHQCLTDRGATILGLIYRCIEAAINYGQECRDLESSLELRDERLEEIITEKYSKIRRTLFTTRQNLCLLLNAFQVHYKKGVETKSRHCFDLVIELLTSLNFNEFYLNQDGESRFTIINK